MAERGLEVIQGNPPTIWGTKPRVFWERTGPLGAQWRIEGPGIKIVAPAGIVGTSGAVVVRGPGGRLEIKFIPLKAQIGVMLPPKVAPAIQVVPLFPGSGK